MGVYKIELTVILQSSQSISTSAKLIDGNDSMRKIKGIENGRWVPYTIATCSAVLLYVVLTNIDGIFGAFSAMMGYAFPVVLGMIIAYILDPLVYTFERFPFGKLRNRRLARNLSVALAFIVLVVFMTILMSALIPQLITSVLGFIDNMDGYINQLLSIINSFGLSVEQNVEGLDLDMSAVTTYSANILGTISSFLRKNIPLVLSSSTSIGNHIFTWIIAIILSIYFLLDRNVILDGVKRFLKLVIPEEKHDDVRNFISRCNSIIGKYVVFEFVDALIVGVSNFIFMTIAQMPYAVLISVVVGVSNLAPTFGPLVGASVGAFILLLANPWKAFAFIIFTIILQTVDGYVIKPKMFGDTLGVSSVVILAFIIIGGRMFNVIGLLLAIPTASIANFVYHEIVLTRLEARRRSQKPNAPDMPPGKEPAAGNVT